MTAVPYHELAGFSSFFFEDSYLLSILILPRKIKLKVDAVLSENHPEYKKPLEGNRYCFKEIEITFNGVNKILDFNINYSYSIDADNKEDMGNIDSLVVHANNTFHIEGPWGNMKFCADSVVIY